MMVRHPVPETNDLSELLLTGMIDFMDPHDIEVLSEVRKHLSLAYCPYPKSDTVGREDGGGAPTLSAIGSEGGGAREPLGRFARQRSGIQSGGNGFSELSNGRF